MRKLIFGIVLLAAGCTTFGPIQGNPDWMVVQYAQDGHPFNCWKLYNTVISTKTGGTLEWFDSSNGHQVRVNGQVNRIRVRYGNFESAAHILGVESSKCGNGIYPMVER